MQDTLFRINHGEVRIGGETFLGHFCNFVVMFNASPTAFFVAADDQFNGTVRHNAFVLQCLQRVQTNYRRGLVVHCAAPPNFRTRYTAVGDIIVDYTAEGRVFPTAACWYNVKVGKDGKIFPLAEHNFTDIVVVVVRFKAHFFRKG